jgi:hypothetical protein
MPHPGDMHHCDKCGSKGAAWRAKRAGLCEHKEPCCGTPALPHDKWSKGIDEVCISCEIVQDAADRLALQQRKRDEKEAKKLRDGAWFKMTMGRNPKKIKTRR